MTDREMTTREIYTELLGEPLHDSKRVPGGTCYICPMHYGDKDENGDIDYKAHALQVTPFGSWMCQVCGKNGVLKGKTMVATETCIGVCKFDFDEHLFWPEPPE